MDAAEVRARCHAAIRHQDAATDALRPYLEEAPARLLDDLVDAAWARHEAERDHLVAELARHLPGAAPAIRALAAHIEDRLDPDDPDLVGGCCERP